MDSYDPWRALGECEGVRLVVADLPGTLRGQIDFATRTITLHPRLLPVERRCTLAHELVHLERGPVLVRLTPREERIVATIAARRLLPIEALADALRWSDDPHVLADELAVDVRTVRVRLATLSDDERAFVHNRLNFSIWSG
jgi:hypothetical protein